MTDASSSTHARTIDALVDQHQELVRRQRELAEVVGRLARGGGRRTAAPVFGPDELIDWVTWLIQRYEIGAVIPECWTAHGAHVEELAALYVAWQDAIDQGGPSHAQWHDQLARSLDRIDGRWRTCTDGEHRSKQLPDWLDTGPLDADRLDLGSRGPVTHD